MKFKEEEKVRQFLEAKQKAEKQKAEKQVRNSTNTSSYNSTNASEVATSKVPKVEGAWKCTGSDEICTSFTSEEACTTGLGQEASCEWDVDTPFIVEIRGKPEVIPSIKPKDRPEAAPDDRRRLD